ncbi:hypothetical protein ANO11243_025670 [Dothideomycetidae sp. 11243]|nr:hypothetical protein ANO11243_025670 [fungal sp. No.11243]
MATIRAIKASSVHQIQSGQVIVDLNSVVKELVENSLDAGATSIALKHHTSKLSSYDDLDSLQTFGFRGEALSSLCALSDFHVITAVAGSAAKGSKLDFDISGKLTGVSVAAAQKGTIVAVEKLFKNLPVRRKELEKNIKREYSKVLNLLQAYACISTNVRFAVWNQMPKGKKASVFTTNSNPTTRENIANVHGAKTLSALINLDLRLEMSPSSGNGLKILQDRDYDPDSREVRIEGHISKPVFGEGRLAPDRQTYFVNSRPCALPQVSKAFNEVYKSFNVSQSPFVFANLIMDTKAYDVNVSPDKRTILLHDQAELLESLKTELTKLFEAQDQTMLASQLMGKKLPAYKQPSLLRTFTSADSGSDVDTESQLRAESPLPSESRHAPSSPKSPSSLIHSWAGRNAQDRRATVLSENHGNPKSESFSSPIQGDDQGNENDLIPEATEGAEIMVVEDEDLPVGDENDASQSDARDSPPEPPTRQVQDFNARLLSQQSKRFERPTRITTETVQLADDASDIANESDTSGDIPSIRPPSHKAAPGPVQNAFDRMRPKRMQEELATVTVGDQTTTMVLGGPSSKRRRIHTPKMTGKITSDETNVGFVSSLRAFAASGSQESRKDHEDAESDNASEVEDVDDGSDAASDMEVDSPSVQGSLSTSRDIRSVSPTLPVQEEISVHDDDDSDDEYMDENNKKAKEEARVAKLIRAAEAAAAAPTEETLRRASQVFRNTSRRKDSTLNLTQVLSVQEETLRIHQHAPDADGLAGKGGKSGDKDEPLDALKAEAKLSLTISKSDFAQMKIIGQFNLGFILATRPASQLDGVDTDSTQSEDHLFIIDQHAADEKFNFERLSSTTNLTPQRLVSAKELQLSAVEEELITNHEASLVANGFQIAICDSNDNGDLEELLHLLSETPLPLPGSSSTSAPTIVRPSRVRKMLAMRACRSSIMVGRTLAMSQMEKVVRNMGLMERPWNCPHGRPTMRHIAGLGEWDAWDGDRGAGVDWLGYMA